jgi:hypothetical protein
MCFTCAYIGKVRRVSGAAAALLLQSVTTPPHTAVTHLRRVSGAAAASEQAERQRRMLTYADVC